MSRKPSDLISANVLHWSSLVSVALSADLDFLVKHELTQKARNSKLAANC